MRPNQAPYREISDRRIDVGDEMKPPRPNPRAFDVDVGQIDRNKLANFGTAIYARDQW